MNGPKSAYDWIDQVWYVVSFQVERHQVESRIHTLCDPGTCDSKAFRVSIKAEATQLRTRIGKVVYHACTLTQAQP